MSDDALDLVDFITQGAHIDENGDTRAGPPSHDVNRRRAVPWNPGAGRAVDVWEDELHALTADLLLTGNVYLELDPATGVAARIDPANIKPT